METKNQIQRREIKFRGKRISDGKWIDGFYFYADRTKQHAIKCSASMGVLVDREFEVIPETIGQFTGLLDKNGKKIFEGDIYKRNADLYLVTCTTLGGFLYRQIYDSWTKRNIFGKMEQSWLSAVECYKYEIIGNIIDNPELIKTL